MIAKKLIPCGLGVALGSTDGKSGINVKIHTDLRVACPALEQKISDLLLTVRNTQRLLPPLFKKNGCSTCITGESGYY